MSSIVDDDFTGSNGDLPDPLKWICSGGSAGDIAIYNNKLRVINNSYLTITSTFTFTGDFDVQIDLDLITYPSTCCWSLGFLMKWGSDYVMVTRRYSSGQKFESLRYISGVFTVISSVTSSITSTKLRITRTGSIFYFYYWNGSGWSGLGNWSGTTSDLTFIIEHGPWSANPSFTGDFDNFVVNSGTVVWPVSSTDTGLDIEVLGYGLTDMSLDIQAAQYVKEDVVIDISAYFQSIGDVSLSVDALGEIALDKKTDISAALQGGEVLPLNIQTAVEQIKNTILDISLANGIIIVDIAMDLDVTDGFKKQNISMDCMTVSTMPEFKSIYAMHLNSAIREITT